MRHIQDISATAPKGGEDYETENDHRAHVLEVEDRRPGNEVPKG